MPSDAQRIDKIMQIIEEKRSHRILIAQDIHTKHRLVSAICVVSSPTVLLQDLQRQQSRSGHARIVP